LRAILESLPEFIGKPRAHVLWNHGNVQIEWSERQVPFVAHTRISDHEAPSLSPELLRTILVDLATAQRELESARRSNQEKDALIQSLQSAAAVGAANASELIQSSQTSGGSVSASHAPALLSISQVEKALHEIYKLGDYFARAQQIVTLLRAPEPLLKRTAWERVSSEAPHAIRKAAMLLRGEEIPVDDVPISPAAEIRKAKTPSFFDTVN
jgi:hypothetical protein